MLVEGWTVISISIRGSGECLECELKDSSKRLMGTK